MQEGVLASDLEGGAGRPLALLMQWGRVGGVHWVVTSWWRAQAEFPAWLLCTPAWGGWSFADFLEWFAWSGTIIV